MASPPVSRSAVTITKVLELFFAKFSDTSIASLNSINSEVIYSMSLACPPQSICEPSTIKKKGSIRLFNLSRVAVRYFPSKGGLPSIIDGGSSLKVKNPMRSEPDFL